MAPASTSCGYVDADHRQFAGGGSWSAAQVPKPRGTCVGDQRRRSRHLVSQGECSRVRGAVKRQRQMVSSRPEPSQGRSEL